MSDDFTAGAEPGRTVEFAKEPIRRRRNPFHWRGYLTPDYDENAKDLSSSYGVNEIQSAIYRIGRNPKSNLVIPSPDVSREHSRVLRIGSNFYIEDLGSRHGTYVNGDRVLWCRLSDGDILQFGARSKRSNVWYFDKAAVRTEASGASLEEVIFPLTHHFPQDQLIVTFWGCRGSVPTPGSHTEAYGGNTTCVEVRFGDELFILDAGTGIRTLGKNWEREFQDRPLKINLLFSHLHWDHIQGFPFLDQAYQPQNSLRIFGIDSGEETVREMLSNQMQGRYFPIPMEAMKANLEFENLDSEVVVGDVTISSISLPHPGGALAYKFETQTGSFIFATDCELDKLAANAEALPGGTYTGREFPDKFLDFFQGVDLLVIDCQYTDEQYETRKGWGHNSISTVIDFCQQTEVRSVALTHHDPASSDAELRSIVEIIDQTLKSTMLEMAPRVFAAREEMTVAVRNHKI